MKGVVGKHIILNFYDVENKKVFNNAEYVKDLMLKLVEISNMTLEDLNVKKFKEGISALALVLESHISLHSWGEYNYVTIDIYTCGEKSDPHKAAEILEKELKPKQKMYLYVDRSHLL